MNKKLLVVAIGAALSSTPMFANAAATVYGAVHLSVDAFDSGETSNTALSDDSLLTMSSNSSFIGIKADEDLGGGVKAIMGAEFQTAFDAASPAFANRNVFAGLKGGFGTVRLGQIDDIVKNVGRKVDMFYSDQIGENRVLTAANAMDARIANGIRYDSPKLGPVTLSAHYGFANDINDADGQSLTTLALGAELNMGGLYVGLAGKSRDVDAGTTSDNTTGMRATASYTFGFGLKLAALYQNFQNDVPTPDVDQTVMGVGVSFKIGNGLIKGQYYTAEESASAANNGAKLMAVGYDHNLSKNTMVYAVYGVVENDPAGTYTLISAGHSNPNDADWTDAGGTLIGADAGAEQSAISLGLKVKF